MRNTEGNIPLTLDKGARTSCWLALCSAGTSFSSGLVGKEFGLFFKPCLPGFIDTTTLAELYYLAFLCCFLVSCGCQSLVRWEILGNVLKAAVSGSHRQMGAKRGCTANMRAAAGVSGEFKAALG